MSTNTKTACEMPTAGGVPEILPSDLEDRKAEFTVVDVRRPDEWTGELGHIEGAEFSTLEAELESDLKKWPKDKTYAFVCRSGGRSGKATQLAASLGFQKVFNMKGGMLAWNESHLPIVRKGRS